MHLSKVQPGYEEAVNRLSLSIPPNVTLLFNTNQNVFFYGGNQTPAQNERLLMWWNDTIATSKKQVVDLITDAYQRDMSH